MMFSFSTSRAKPTKTRKAPFLPRIGIVVDFLGTRFSYKQVPMLETFLNLLERGFSATNLSRFAKEAFAEVAFPGKLVRAPAARRRARKATR